MATAIASNRASNASIRRKTLSLFSLPGQGRKAGSSLNRNVAFNVALTGCFVMHFYSDSPMHLLSGLDTHQRFGKYDAEQLLDRIQGEAREVRKLIEAIDDPAG